MNWWILTRSLLRLVKLTPSARVHGNGEVIWRVLREGGRRMAHAQDPVYARPKHAQSP
jgi:hypothetical protein